MTLRRAILACLWASAAIPLAAGAQEIPREEYLDMLPLSLPRLGLQNEASAALNLYGDRSDPGYVDVDPVDGIDDRRHAVLMDLAVHFAPYLVQNTTNVPLNFETFIENRDTFALVVDTWNVAGEEVELEQISGVNLSVLGSGSCDPALRGSAFERFPEPTMDPAVEDCKLLELMERYTPGAGITSSRDEALIRRDPSLFDVLYFNFPGEGERTWSVAYEPEWERTPEERRASFVHSYVHPFLVELEEGGYELILQYWFFYPSNDSGMDHEGDWEHINVIVSPRSMVEGGLDEQTVEAILDGSIPISVEIDDPLVIKRVDYYFHELVWPLDFSDPNVYLPREEWEARMEELPRERYRQREIWRRVRYMAYADDDETIVNTHPLGYIGADNKGLNQALEPPGGSNQEPHGTYPFPGRYNNVGPGGTTDHQARFVDIREHLRRVADGTAPEGPTFRNRAVIGLADADRLRIVPDWERVVGAARQDPAVRRSWAWLLLPIRWGYPATRSPFAGVLKHYNTGNVAPQGPSLNAGWNTTGASAGFELYEPHELPSIFPLQAQDNFRNDLGFLNLTVPLFLNLPPFDFVARLVSYPFRAAFGRHDPVYYPRDGLPFRFVGLSGGVFTAGLDENFSALTLNDRQRPQLIQSIFDHLADNGADGSTAVTGGSDYRSDWVGPFGQIAFYIGDHFVSENTLRHARTGFGARVDFNNIPSYTLDAEVNYWEYSGSLRYSVLTGNVQPFVKGGYGWSWYRLENLRFDGIRSDEPRSRWFSPGIWPSVWHYGLGVEWIPWRRSGVASGGFEVALRAEFARYQQSLQLDLSDVPLDELEFFYSDLGDVPSSSRVFRNELLLGMSVTF